MIIMKKKNKKKTAIIYIRLSSKKQEKGMSRYEQERLCREYCEERGIEIIGIYYENKSAMTPYARLEFMKMIAFQKSDLRADYVITMCVNRLTRNHVDLYPIEDIVNNYGTKLVFVKENLCLQKPIKASEGFLYDIIVANAKFEVKHMNEIRKEGLLALEEAANESIEDEFVKKGVLLIVDGTDPEFVRSILETELSCISDRHKSIISFWESLGSMGPAWGMIGTLIGLINMLGNLEDINSVGPNMAVALVTTFYGSILANCISTRWERALRSFNKEVTAREPSKFSALRIMPSLTSPFLNWRGARLAMNNTCLPTSSSGW